MVEIKSQTHAIDRHKIELATCIHPVDPTFRITMSEEMNAVVALLGMTYKSGLSDKTTSAKRTVEEGPITHESNYGDNSSSPSTKRQKSGVSNNHMQSSTGESKIKTGGRRGRKAKVEEEVHQYPVPPRVVQVCKVPKTHIDQ
jgi:hypothetical protein